MKIKNLSAKNFKGSTFNHLLASLTVFHGSNFSGKSSRREALELALTGAVSGIGARPGDLFDRLASGSSMSVRAEVTPNLFVERILDRDKKGKISFGGSASGDLKDSVPKILFDASEFLGLSGKEQVRFLFRVLPPPPLDQVGPATIVSKLKTLKFDDHNAAHETAITAACDKVTSSFEDSGPGETIQEWLEHFCEEAATNHKEATAAAKTLRQTVTGSFALAEDAPATAPLEVAKSKAQDRLTQAIMAEQKALSEFSAAEVEVQKAKETAGKSVDAGKVQVEIAEQEQVIAEAKQVSSPGERPGGKLMLNPRPTNSGELEAFRAAQAAVNESAKAMVVEQTEIQRIEAAIKAAESQTKCPHCQQDITGQQAEVIKRLKKQLGSNKDTNQGSPRWNLAKAQAEHEVNRQAEEQAAEKVKRIGELIAQWDAAKATLDKQNAAALEAWCQSSGTYQQALNRINGANAHIAALRLSIAGNQAATEAWAKLPVLETASQQAGQVYAAAKAAATEARSAYQQAEAKHQAAVTVNANLANAAKAAMQADLKDAEVVVWKELRSILDALLGEAVKHSVLPLLDICNQLGAGILNAPVAFMEGELGLARPTGFINHRSLSGTEKALLHASISVALAASSPVKLLVLDEIGRLDYKNRGKLYERLLKLIQSGELEQAIVLDTQEPPVESSKTTAVYKLGGVK